MIRGHFTATAMDEIFDQWFSSSPWTANGASANRPVFWEASAAATYHNSAGVMPMDSAADFQAQHKASENSILAGMGLERQEGSLTHGIYEGNVALTPQPPIFDTGQGHNLPLQPMHPAWYVGGGPPAGGDLNTGKVQAFTLEQVDPPAEDPHSGKWQQDDDSLSTENCPWNTPHLAASEGIKSVQSSEDQITSVAPDPSGGVAGGSSKSRVRARRGQATDPHSIAERHRRERIAERMKALQELVPDSNKTDKASMLDEIIHYVKFLQMQVKCLSMCRLGGAGAAGPLLAELPGEGASSLMETSTAPATSTEGGSSTSLKEGMAFAERQVARLMDEDMSAAMQYLQSKGLCLMPISLATAISSSGVRPPPTKVGLDTTDGNMK